MFIYLFHDENINTFKQKMAGYLSKKENQDRYLTSAKLNSRQGQVIIHIRRNRVQQTSIHCSGRLHEC